MSCQNKNRERVELWQEELERKHGKVIAYCHTDKGLKAIHMFTHEILGDITCKPYNFLA